MSRRRSRAAYYRKNPLSTTELVVGGLVTAAVVGLGGYLVYQATRAPSQAAGAPQYAQPGQFGSATAAGVDAYGNPLPPAVGWSSTTSTGMTPQQALAAVATGLAPGYQGQPAPAGG